MKIRLLAVGQKMPKWVQQTFADYNNRLNKNQQLQLKEIVPVHRGKSISAHKARALECDQIMAEVKSTETIVLLDELGRNITTKNIAESIQSWQMNATDIAIVIGGADGVSDALKQKAQHTWSLSRLTFPHPLVRVIVMEQIYRAYSLIANHPYHRE